MSKRFKSAAESIHERLVRHVQTLERLEALKHEASALFAEGFQDAKNEGFDPATLKVVLKLRKMTPSQRRDRRALEAIYLASLGMLDGDALPDIARRRLAGQPDDPTPTPPPPPPDDTTDSETAPAEPPRPEQPALALKDPEEAKQEGGEAAAAGKRIYDNPYPAGDPCRAAWDEGWCAQRKSHGMDPPAAYQRRTEKPADKSSKPGKDDKDDQDQEGAA